MSAATKRKHVTREVVEEIRLPTENEKIVKVLAGRGNNLHEVVDSKGDSCLVSMPTKFRKSVWIKRDDYLFITPIDEGDKVKGEISAVLYRDQIKYLKREGAWPAEFENSAASEENKADLKEKEEEDKSDSCSESDDDADLFQNTNRRDFGASSDSEESDVESDEE